MAGLTGGRESCLLTFKGGDGQGAGLVDAPHHWMSVLTPVKFSPDLKLCQLKRLKYRCRNHEGRGRSPRMTQTRRWSYPVKKWTPMVRSHHTQMASNKGCISPYLLLNIWAFYPSLAMDVAIFYNDSAHGRIMIGCVYSWNAMYSENIS